MNMNFDQVVVREFLKLNPGFTDTPSVLVPKRVGTSFTGSVTFPNTVDAEYVGAKVVNAAVPDLSKLFMGVTPTIEIYKPTTTRDIASALFAKYGVVANVEDITLTAVSYDPLPTEVTITAMPTATTVAGTLTVQVSQLVKDLSEIVTTLEVDGVIDRYPMSMVGLNVTKMYYGHDFTKHREKLSKFVSGTGMASYGEAKAVYDILVMPDIVEIFGDPGWKCDFSSSYFDLREVIIRYNGVPNDSNLGAHSYKRCLMVESVRHGYTLVFNYDI